VAFEMALEVCITWKGEGRWTVLPSTAIGSSCFFNTFELLSLDMFRVCGGDTIAMVVGFDRLEIATYSLSRSGRILDGNIPRPRHKIVVRLVVLLTVVLWVELHEHSRGEGLTLRIEWSAAPAKSPISNPRIFFLLT